MAGERRIRTDDGVGLVFSVAGAGSPLVLIPGLGATRRVYDPILPSLTENHRVIVYDPRGTGGSDVPDGPYSMDRLAADCVEVAAAAGAERFHLFGASMGGLTAQHVAVRHGDRLDRLVLAATGPGRQRVAAADTAATAALLGGGARTPAEAYRTACTVLYSQSFQREHADFIAAEVEHRGRHPVAGRGFAAQLGASRSSDISHRISEIRAPTLVMHGVDDVVVPLANAELLARGIPGARHRWFEGCGHLFFHEEPRLTAEAVLDFLG